VVDGSAGDCGKARGMLDYCLFVVVVVVVVVDDVDVDVAAVAFAVGYREC